MKKNWLKNFSAFEIVSIVSICIMVVVIVITAIVIAEKKTKIDEMEEKNKEVQVDSTTSYTKLEQNLLNEIEKYNQL